MTPEETLRKLQEKHKDDDLDDEGIVKILAQVIREAIAEEREECAKIAEYSWEINPGDNIYALSSIIAKAIRRPGKEQG